MNSLSKMILGTVQFGIDYGISNTIGKTHSLEVKEILQYASKQGINTLDIAPSYGNSESLVTDYISNYDKSNSWDVITKTPHFKGNEIDGRQIYKLIESIDLLHKKIGKRSIYGLLVHNCDDLFLPGADNLMNTLECLKKEGIIKKIGVSVYNSQQIDYLLDNFSIDLIQLPINILDQRLINDGSLVKLKKHNVEIHARSVFLQGLLLMPIDTIPSWFNPIKDALKLFHKQAKKQNLTKLQLALGFVQSLIEIDKVVVGVNSLEQLYEIVSASSVRVNITELSNISINSPIFLNPSNWRV
jgi:aryl-alcohol dehydrogenase-like predicted oxidoreductase